MTAELSENEVFRDEPEARARYEALIAALRTADTLYFESAYQRYAQAQDVRYKEIARGRYRLWLRKPNHARMKVVGDDGDVTGVLVLDGARLWAYWPGERPCFYLEAEAVYQKTRRNAFLTKPAPLAQHSIAHEANGWFFVSLILDPSVFHGLTDPKEPYRDGVRALGSETLGGEICDGIEVSFMDHQRSWYLWLSRRGSPSRRLDEKVRVAQALRTTESWSEIAVNAPMESELFTWTPPAGWVEWHPPGPEAALLKPGTPAPDFSLRGADGETITLSSFHGQVVALVIWRVGCQPCREALPGLQKLHATYRDQGVVVLGLNCADDPETARALLRDHGADFPTVLDPSEAAKQIVFGDYRAMAVPTTYLIGRDGRIADAWCDDDPPRLLRCLESFQPANPNSTNHLFD